MTTCTRLIRKIKNLKYYIKYINQELNQYMISVYDSDRNSCRHHERLRLASWELISERCTADLKIHLNLYCILEKLIH